MLNVWWIAHDHVKLLLNGLKGTIQYLDAAIIQEGVVSCEGNCLGVHVNACDTGIGAVLGDCKSDCSSTTAKVNDTQCLVPNQ